MIVKGLKVAGDTNFRKHMQGMLVLLINNTLSMDAVRFWCGCYCK